MEIMNIRVNQCTLSLLKSYHPIPWRDSISRLIALVSSVAGGDEPIHRPRRQGKVQGCQICLDTKYQNEGKYTKLPQYYKMAIKYSK
jgi:hypothetical protein